MSTRLADGDHRLAVAPSRQDSDLASRPKRMRSSSPLRVVGISSASVAPDAIGPGRGVGEEQIAVHPGAAQVGGDLDLMQLGNAAVEVHVDDDDRLVLGDRVLPPHAPAPSSQRQRERRMRRISNAAGVVIRTPSASRASCTSPPEPRVAIRHAAATPAPTTAPDRDPEPGPAVERLCARRRPARRPRAHRAAPRGVRARAGRSGAARS